MKGFSEHWEEVREKLAPLPFAQKKALIQALNHRDPRIHLKALADIKKLKVPKR